MRINHNIPALRTLNQLSKTNSLLDKTMQRLSSGLRINSAADDAAGLAISQKMDTQIRGLKQASRNAMDGISLIQTAEGALNEVQAMLQRIRELAVQSSNGTLQDEEDREAISSEVRELKEEIERISNDTEFNKIALLNGNISGGIDFQIGANEGQIMKINIQEVSTSSLGISDVTLSSASVSQSSIGKLDNAIAILSSVRSQLGAYQNRLEHTATNLDVAAENMTASLSRIQDADMAEEMAEYTQKNILSQAGTSMLAQANQRPQQILQLLQG